MHIKKLEKIRESSFNFLLIVLSLSVTISAILFGTGVRNGYDIEVGTISDKKFRAPREVVNKIATDKLKKSAYESVMPTYDKNPDIEEKVMTNLKSFFEDLDQVRSEYLKKLSEFEKEKNNNELKNEPITGDIPKTDNETDLLENTLPEETPQSEDIITEIPALTEEQLILQLEKQLSVYLTERQLSIIFNLNNEKYIQFKKNIEQVLQKTFEYGIKEDEKEKTLLFIKEKSKNLYFDSELEEAAVEISSYFTEINLIVNTVATEAARQQKVSEVKSVKFLKNQTIVDEGQFITEEVFDVLNSLGFVQKSYSDVAWLIIGSLSITVIIFFICIYYIIYYPIKNLTNRKEKLLLFVLYNSCIILIWSLSGIPQFLIPILIFTILISILIDMNLAIIINVCFASLAVLISNIQLEYFIYFLLSGTIIALFSRYLTERSKIIFVGLITSIVNAIILFGVIVFTTKSLTPTLFSDMIMVFLDGFFIIILSVGSLPFWEVAFGVITVIKLLDLTNPNNLVLRRLTIEAPGTYHHSLIVANLAEAAAIDTGANPVLARVGGYYHDIGKLKYPHYFSENQGGENPHDYMDPYSSVQVIRSHVSYGLELANNYHLPKVVKDMIVMHQGNTLIKYFYYKAKKENPESEVLESDFRYHFATPQFKEAAIIMLADTIEAAVRSMIPSGKTMEEVEVFVRVLIKDKLEDNQLQDSMLTIKDLETIITSFLRVFKGMYHERIAYPSEKNEE